MFRLNDPILIPHRDFLRSFFLDQPISGPRPPDQLTHGPELVVVMHRAALGNKRSPVPAIAIARTPSRERLKEIPKKLSEGGGDVTSTPWVIRQGQWPPPPLPSSDDDTTLPSSLNAANIQIAIRWNH